MPSKPKKDKSEQPRCEFCSKKIFRALSDSTQTWLHANSGESWSNSPIGHNAKRRSRKQT